MNNKERFYIQKDSEFKERRKKTDWVTHMAVILSGLSWLIALVVIAVLNRASPEDENYITRVAGTQVRDYWDTAFLPLAFRLLIASLCICTVAFVFNILRKRRKSDKYKKSIIIIGIINIVSIAVFLIQFGDQFLW